MKHITKQLTPIPLTHLHPHPADPFKPYSNDKLKELSDSIAKYGLFEPIVVKEIEKDSYAILAGKNRTNAARLNGSTEIDAFVCDVDDDTAVMIITDSNLKHRDQLLPSERGFAYRMQLEALKRQGKRTDLEEVLTSAQFAQKFNSREMVAAHNAVSKDEVWRYIRLTYLIPDLLTLVDQKVLPFIAGIDLSFLDEASQQIVYDILITDQQMEIDLDKSGYLKKLYRAIGTFTKESLRDLIFQFRGTKSRVVPLINRSMLKSIVTDIELPDDETLIHLFAAFLRDTYNARGSINVVHETRKEFY